LAPALVVEPTTAAPFFFVTVPARSLRSAWTRRGRQYFASKGADHTSGHGGGDSSMAQAGEAKNGMRPKPHSAAPVVQSRVGGKEALIAKFDGSPRPFAGLKFS